MCRSKRPFAGKAGNLCLITGFRNAKPTKISMLKAGLVY